MARRPGWRFPGPAGVSEVWTGGRAVCDDPLVHETTSVFVFMGVLLVVMGVAGYFMYRRRGRDELRRFFIWYAFVWPFMGCGLCAMSYPSLHWLYYVEFALAAASYGVQIPGLRRGRAKARTEVDQRRRKF